MPLTALNENKKLLTSYRDIEEIKNSKNLECPNCLEKTIFVNAELKIKHFRHWKRLCSYFTEPETETHMKMKKEIAEILAPNGQITLEKKIENRITDIEIIMPTGQKIAVECQASAINYSNFMERTKDLNRNDHSVLWIFDGKKITNKSTYTKYKYSGNITTSTSVGEFLKEVHKNFFGRIYIYLSEDETITSWNPSKEELEYLEMLNERELKEHIQRNTDKETIKKGIYAVHLITKNKFVYNYPRQSENEEPYEMPYKRIKFAAFHPITDFRLFESINDRTGIKIAKFSDIAWWIKK